MMKLKQKRREAALRKELLAVEKQEKKIQQAALKARSAAWKEELENWIPEKVYTGLESAFCKGFGLVFNQGRVIIEKGYNKEKIQTEHAIRDSAVQAKGRRKELRKIHKSARQSDFLNLTVTTVEGIGLGALGVGMPDIVLFLGTLLKGIYETALNYGFDYESKSEQILILKMMQTSLSTGEDWMTRNTEVDEMLILETIGITDEDIKQLSEQFNIPYEKVVNKTLELHEFNPMLGHRGCRLAVTYPEIWEAQPIRFTITRL